LHFQDEIRADVVDKLYQQFWRLEGLYQLNLVYKEIRRYLPSFLKLFKLMKQQKMMSEQDLVDALRVGKELSQLKDQFQLLVEEINSLEYKKKWSQNCFVCSAKSNIQNKGIVENLSIGFR
jgi:hypothetical protein